jgi:uncharacterized membrane-anchored protein YitT (DUF2179 family)
MVRLLKIILACFITSFGVIVMRHAHVVTGGTAGLTLNLTYLIQVPFAWLFFLINIPFYFFSFLRMGKRFTFDTLFAVTVLTLFTSIDQSLTDFSVPPWIGAIAGGLIIGWGLSMLFRNRASLGGANILALYLQRRWNWDPGKVNLAFDVLVVLIGIYSVGLKGGLYSIISIWISSVIISRYKHKIAVSMKEPVVVKQDFL